MAYINAIEGAAEFVHLYINSDGITAASDLDTVFTTLTDSMEVPALQEVTVNATPGLFRWKQLDSLSEFVVTTPSTNSINTTLVLDPTTFFVGDGTTDGIFDLTNNKTLIAFRFYWQGNSAGDKYVQGLAYLSGLAPTVSPDSPVFTAPVTLEVVGNFTPGTQA